MISPLIAVLAVAALGLTLSQFGGRLAARNAVVWWLGLGFFMLSAVVPELLRPIADLLGIKLISNFVLATMIVFLLYNMIEQTSTSTRQARNHRQLVSRLAVQEYIRKREDLRSTGTDGQIRILIVLPCFNEAGSLPRIVADLKNLSRDPAFDFNYCIINDGSTDASDIILQDMAPRNHVSHLVNIGVAGALMTGFKIAHVGNYDYVVQCDSDGQHPIPFIPDFVKRASACAADLFIGSRFASDDGKTTGDRAATTTWRRLGSLMIRGVLLLFGRSATVTDPTSGFRVFTRRFCEIALLQMPDEYPEPELLALAAVSGGKIAETKVLMTPRTAGRSSILGLQVFYYMVKVITALLGLRLRTFSHSQDLSERQRI